MTLSISINAVSAGKYLLGVNKNTLKPLVGGHCKRSKGSEIMQKKSTTQFTSMYNGYILNLIFIDASLSESFTS